MQDQVVGNRLIAKNATMLYLRMFVTLAISFYTSRIVLKALGVSDYGVYNVVGGVIVMISTLTGALGGATSRFLTFALGKKDLDNLKLTFSTAFYIHLSLAVLFVVVAESIGVWFVNTQLVIPEGRMGAANWVFQAAILSTAMGMTQTPYSASITSHERMGAFAYIAILDAVIKLGIAFVVLYSSVDHLKLYSILLMVMSVGFQLYYRFYCIRHFDECHITRRFDKRIFREMLSFSGWSMVNSIAFTISQQGTNVFINRFFGTLINAAAGVAGQVQGILFAFAGNASVAFRPQIIKEYAVGNYKRVEELIDLGTSLTVFLVMMTTVPIFFCLQFLMSLWLVEVPVGAVAICQVMLISNFLLSFNPFMNFAIIASGKIRNQNILFSILHFLYFFCIYLILKLGSNYIWIYLFSATFGPISTGIYIYYLKKYMPSFSAGGFIAKIMIPGMIICAVSCFIGYVIYSLNLNPWLQCVVTFLLCDTMVCLLSYRFLLTEANRKQALAYIKSILHLKS